MVTRLRILAVLGGVLSGAVAAPPARADEAELRASDGPGRRRFGAMLDVGAPDGGTASLVYRPAYWARVHGGASHNLVSPGVRLGASLIPFDTLISPSIVVDAGRFFESDANGLARRFDASHEDSVLLERIGYDYASAQLGLNIGTDRVTFFVQGGVSYLRGNLHGLDEQLAMESEGPTAVTFGDDPQISARIVSARLGFVVYLVQ